MLKRYDKVGQEQIYNFLKNNKSKSYTIKEIASILGLRYNIACKSLCKIRQSNRNIKRNNINGNLPDIYCWDGGKNEK